MRIMGVKNTSDIFLIKKKTPDVLFAKTASA